MTTYALSQLPWKSKSLMPDIGKDEKLLRTSHRHWMKYVVPVFTYLVLMPLGTALLLFSASFLDTSSALAFGAFFTALITLSVVQHWFFHFLLSENVTDVILTNKRILHMDRSLWFLDTMDEMVLARIKMVEVHKKGLLQRILDYGDLWVDTGGGQSIAYLPSPNAWAQEIERHIK